MKYLGSTVADEDLVTKKYVDDAIAGSGGGGGAPATTTTPAMDGTASVGSENKYARGDHVHPTDTSRAPIDNPEFTTRVTSPLFKVTGHSSAIGAGVGPNKNTSSVSVNATTNKNICSCDFDAGTWLIIGTLKITKPSNTTYARTNLSKTSADSSTIDDARYMPTTTDTVITISKVFVLTQQTRIYLNVYTGRAVTVPSNGGSIEGYRLL